MLICMLITGRGDMPWAKEGHNSVEGMTWFPRMESLLYHDAVFGYCERKLVIKEKTRRYLGCVIGHTEREKKNPWIKCFYEWSYIANGSCC